MRNTFGVAALFFSFFFHSDHADTIILNPCASSVLLAERWPFILADDKDKLSASSSLHTVLCCLIAFLTQLQLKPLAEEFFLLFLLFAAQWSTPLHSLFTLHSLTQANAHSRPHSSCWLWNSSPLKALHSAPSLSVPRDSSNSVASAAAYN